MERKLEEVHNFLDVDGDGYVSPSDALSVINYLNATNPARRSDPYFQELSESPSKPPEDNDSAEMLFLLASDQVLASNRRRGA